MALWVPTKDYDAIQSADAEGRVQDMMDEFKAAIAPPPPAQPRPTAIPTTADISNPQSGTGRYPSLTLADIQRIAKQSGHSDEGARAAMAIAQTEGGLTGAAGDSGQSVGPFQFYSGGQLVNFAKQHGMDMNTAHEYVLQHPAEAAQWALQPGGYLGDTIRQGEAKGIAGAALATHAQRNGQVSVTPERAGQNYDALFGGAAQGIGDFLGNVGRTVGEGLSQAGAAIGEAVRPSTPPPTSLPPAPARVNTFAEDAMAKFTADISPQHEVNAPPPDTTPQQPGNFLEDAMSKFQEAISPQLGAHGEAIGNILEASSRPSNAVMTGTMAGLKGQDVLSGVQRGLSREETVTGTDVLGQMGVPEGPRLELGPANFTARDVAGFGADILTDPLNVTPFAAAKIGKLAAKVAPDIARGARALNAGEMGAIRVPGAAQRAATLTKADITRSLDQTGSSPLQTDFLYTVSPSYAGGDLGPLSRGVNLNDPQPATWLTGGAPIADKPGQALAIDRSRLDPALLETASNGYPVYRGTIPVDAITNLGPMVPNEPLDLLQRFHDAAGTPPIEPPRPPTSGGPGTLGALGSSGETGAIRLPADTPPVTFTNPTNIAMAKMFEEGLKPAVDSTPMLERAWTATVRATADRGVDLKKFQDLAAAQGVHLSPDQLVSYQSRANPTGPAVIKLQQELRPALLEVAGNEQPLSVYLAHVQDIDRAHIAAGKVYTTAENAALKRGATAADAAAAGAAKSADFLANKFTLPGGHTLAEAQKGLADLPGEVGPASWAKIQSAGQQVQGFTRSLLDRKLDAGLVTQDLHDALIQMYPNYVPTRILEFIDETAKTGATGKKINVTAAGIKKYALAGTDLTREDPVPSIVRLTYQTEALAQKNITANALIKARDVIPGMDKVIREVENGYSGKVGLGETAMSLFDQGVKKTYLLPEEYAKLIENKPLGSTMFDVPMMLFKMGTTGRNPLFVPWNAARDIATYAVTQTTAAGGIAHIPEVMTELFKAYGDAFAGLRTGTYAGQGTQGYLKSGGWMLGRYSGGIKETAETVSDLSRRNFYTIRDGKDLQKFITNLLLMKPVEAVGGRVELAPRVAASNLALKRGSSPLVAAMTGREATVDFEMGGNLARVLNQAIPFFNVGVQGALMPIRTLHRDPRAFLSGAIAVIAGPAIAAEAWNRSDSQRAQDYADVPAYIKGQGIPIMLPRNLFPPQKDAQGNEYPQFVLLPLRDFLPIALLTQEATRRAMGDASPTDWAGLVGNSAAALSPTQATSALGLLPPGVGTAVELGVNQDSFRNRMIATNRNDERAIALAKAISYGINAASGAVTDFTHGQINPPTTRPSTVEYAITDPSGGFGQMMTGASEMISPQKPPITGFQSTPVVGGLAARWVRGSVGGRLEETRNNLINYDDAKFLKDTGADWAPTPVGYSIGKVNLTNAEEEEYQKIVNAQLTKIIAPLKASAAWKVGTPDNKLGYLQDRYEKLRASVRDYIVSKGGRDFSYRQYQAETAQGGG